MTQNINLLEEIELPNLATITSKLILQLAITLVLILTVVSLIHGTTLSQDKKKLSQIEISRSNVLNKIKIMKQKNTSISYDIGMDSSGHKIGSKTGFHQYLHGITKLIPRNVWITNIILSKSENTIVLRGHALCATDVANLVFALENAENLHEKTFSILQIKKNESTQEIDFTVATETKMSSLKTNGSHDQYPN